MNKTGKRLLTVALAATVLATSMGAENFGGRAEVQAASAKLKVKKKKLTTKKLEMDVRLSTKKKVKSYIFQVKGRKKWLTISKENTTKKHFTYSVTGLSAGETYTFRVRAYKKKNCKGALSKYVKLKVKAPKSGKTTSKKTVLNQNASTGKNGEKKNTSKTTSMTQKQVQERLISVMEEYPEGTRWTNANSYVNTLSYEYEGYTYPAGSFTGYGCAGFALMLQEFGENYQSGIRQVHGSYDNLPKIRVGDTVRLAGSFGDHSVIVLGVEADGHTVTVAEGNYNSSVHWGRVIDLSDPDNGFQYIETFWK